VKTNKGSVVDFEVLGVQNLKAFLSMISTILALATLCSMLRICDIIMPRLLSTSGVKFFHGQFRSVFSLLTYVHETCICPSSKSLLFLITPMILLSSIK